MKNIFTDDLSFLLPFEAISVRATPTSTPTLLLSHAEFGAPNFVSSHKINFPLFQEITNICHSTSQNPSPE